MRKKQNLSAYNPEEVPNAEEMKFGIVVAEWNSQVTDSLLGGCVETLRKYGVIEKNIYPFHVPGAFELTYGAKVLAKNIEHLNGIILLGCVVQGETPHFDYICKGITYGVTQLNIDFPLPFVFGVLTTLNMEQALERSGGKHGNKGIEAAVTAIKMAHMEHLVWQNKL